MWKIVCVGCIAAAAFVGCKGNENTGGPSTTPAVPTMPGVGDVKAQADKVMGEVEKAINDKKWDAADAGMAQLNKLKPSLPAEVAGKISALQKKLDDAKAATQPKP